MSFDRVKLTGWAVGEVLTSAQANALDIDHTNAVDKRSPGLEIDSRSVTRWMPALGAAFTSTEWDTFISDRKTTVNTEANLVFALDVPHGATITAISVWLKGAAGHGALPAGMPHFSALAKHLNADDAQVDIATTTTDSSANPTAFQAWHAITKSSLSYVVDRSAYSIALIFSSESSTNALSGALVRGVQVTFTSTRIDEA